MPGVVRDKSPDLNLPRRGEEGDSPSTPATSGLCATVALLELLAATTGTLVVATNLAVPLVYRPLFFTN